MMAGEIKPDRTYTGPPGRPCRHVLRIVAMDGFLEPRVVYESLEGPVWNRARTTTVTTFARWATGVIE